ncbi:efflux RND transporter periplasmic adaptor subunit [Clostridium magnum]|uniref:Macrolide export protein MacA n=1 Tax=Clostridium magnum DSM 2767 TaxID=1121326 RepID=A0A162SME1_9CLOT|nr:efflux RND transporter periplasmic adaptor subunit [Clostridium magnum]KZL91611.1 macrolide export protein MacA [Clostridium magnum DSM 2767]SHH49427.1 RND family efflux transporter, MFP subunit [Clostridium magnum DSM 2767]
MKFRILNKKNLIIGVILILIIAGSASILGKNKKVEEKQDVKSVKVEKVSVGSISTEVEYASKLNPVQEVTIFPKSGGKVASLNVDIGDKVTAGQVLFALDTAELQAQLQAQQAALAASNANLAKTSDSGLQQQITSSEQNVAKAQIAYNNAKDNYNKMEKLYDAGAVSKQELDNAKLKYDNYSVDLKAAQDNLNLLIEKSGPQSTQVATAQVAQSQAGVNSAQIQLNNATITAPISGVVSAKDVKVGQLASSQSGSVTIIDSSSFIAEISVPDKIIGKVQVGQSVQVSISALENKKVSGVIDKISPNSNSKDNSYTIKVKVDNSNGELTAGMFAKVSLPSENKNNILTVPNEAIKMENNVNYLYLAENGKVKKVSVDTGISNDKVTEINGNIKEGADVIIEGQNLLSNGDKINVVK